jgi:hypothetical protein
MTPGNGAQFRLALDEVMIMSGIRVIHYMAVLV